MTEPQELIGIVHTVVSTVQFDCIEQRRCSVGTIQLVLTQTSFSQSPPRDDPDKNEIQDFQHCALLQYTILLHRSEVWSVKETDGPSNAMPF